MHRPNSTLSSAARNHSKAHALTNRSHELPLCCLRFIHIHKAGGTSFERWVTQGHAQGLQIGGSEQRPANGSERAITFHHDYDWFARSHKWEAPCVRGVVLREPLSHFVSSVAYVHAKKNPWDADSFYEDAGCGFLFARHGTPLADCWCPGYTRCRI